MPSNRQLILHNVTVSVFNPLRRQCVATEPSYLYDLIYLNHIVASTRCSDVVTLASPPLYSSENQQQHRLVSGMNFPKNFANLLMMSPYVPVTFISSFSHRLIIITIIITTFTMHHSISFPLQTQNLSFS